MTLITMIICATFIMGMLYEYYDARLRNELKSKAQYRSPQVLKPPATII